MNTVLLLAVYVTTWAVVVFPGIFIILRVMPGQ